MRTEDFIKIWQTSHSLEEVAARADMTKNQASVRAAYIRKRWDVDLQKFNTVWTGAKKHQIDGEKLRKLAKELKP